VPIALKATGITAASKLQPSCCPSISPEEYCGDASVATPRNLDERIMSVHEAEAPEQEFARVLTIAKEALKYVGVFRTPPTPSVYDVWYRYVEGSDTALREQLSHSVTVSRSVSKQQLEFIHQQFSKDLSYNDSVDRVSERLVREIESIGQLLGNQMDMSEHFGQQVHAAQDTLSDAVLSPLALRTCVEQLAKCNSQMITQLSQVQTQLSDSRQQISELKDDLVQSQRELLKDPLTGVGNRRYYDHLVKRAMERREEVSHPLFMFLVDIDKLKVINLDCGQLVGDDILRHTAKAIEAVFSTGSVARLFDDEFVIITHIQDATEAIDTSKSLCRYFSGRRFESDRTGAQVGLVTVSIGAAQLRSDDDEASWFERAEKLLTCAKSSGGNQSMVERELVER
jgi:diguanylate cyclase